MIIKRLFSDKEETPGRALGRAGLITAGIGAGVGAAGYAVSKGSSVFKHGIKGKAIRSLGGKYAMAAAPIVGLVGGGLALAGGISNKKSKSAQREFGLKMKAAKGGLEVLDKLSKKAPQPVSRTMGGISTALPGQV